MLSQQKSEELINGIDKKLDVILEMLENKRPADQRMAVSYCKDIKRSLESTLNLISIS
jgi:hypothetical protein